MEIRRIISSLSPVKSRIAVLSFFSVNYANFIITLINKRLISLIPLFYLSGTIARGWQTLHANRFHAEFIFLCPGIKVSLDFSPDLARIILGAGATCAHKQGSGERGGFVLFVADRIYDIRY